MLPISIRDGISEIVFNRNFYDIFPITEVCERFQDISKIEVIFSEDNSQIKVCISPKAELDLQEISLEFCNHCLHEQAAISK